QFFKYGNVLGIVDPRNGPLDMEIALGQLAGYQVVLVRSRYRYKNIGMLCAGLGKQVYVSSVAMQHRDFQVSRQLVAVFLALFNYGNPVLIGQKCLHEVISHFAGTNNEYVHNICPYIYSIKPINPLCWLLQAYCPYPPPRKDGRR